MPYKAYRDIEKTKEIKACETTIDDVGEKFYCSTIGCRALMTLVNGGNPEHAYFRRISSSPRHSSIFCSADGHFDPTKYDESTFKWEDVFAKLLHPANASKSKVGKGRATITGGGGRKTISTVHQIYCMCRKYKTYNGYLSDDILADERNSNKYKIGIYGKKIVQCTPYHKVYNELAYEMNYPLFPYKDCKHIKLNFSNKELFWTYYRKFRNTDYKNLLIVLGNWTLLSSSNEFIAECTINTACQIYFLKE